MGKAIIGLLLALPGLASAQPTGAPAHINKSGVVGIAISPSTVTASQCLRVGTTDFYAGRGCGEEAIAASSGTHIFTSTSATAAVPVTLWRAVNGTELGRVQQNGLLQFTGNTTLGDAIASDVVNASAAVILHGNSVLFGTSTVVGAGRLGIGTYLPNTKAHLSSGVWMADGTGAGFRLGGTDANFADWAMQFLLQHGACTAANGTRQCGLMLDGTLNQQANIGMRVKTGGVAGISGLSGPLGQIYNVGQNAMEIYTGDAVPLVLGTNGVKRLTLDAAGSVTAHSTWSFEGTGNNFAVSSSSGVKASSGAVLIDGAGSTFAKSTGAVAGAPISGILSNAATLDFGALAANVCIELTMTVNGASDGDPVFLGVPDTLATTANAIFTGWVSTHNTVTVSACCVAVVACSADLPSASVRATVFKF